MGTHQPEVQSLPKLVRQLQPFMSPMGASDVAQQQAHASAAWDELQAKVQDRQNQLQGVLEERQIFWDNWGSLENLLDKAQKKLDGTKEIYADEVKDTMNRAKVIGVEVHESRPELEKLGQAVQEMLHYASPEEQQMLREHFEELQREFDSTEDLASCRVELCQQWGEYKDASKGAQAKIRGLQQKLVAKDLSQDEIDGINKELCQVQDSLREWEGKKADIDQLMDHSKMTIKDRASHRPLHFQDEVQVFQNSLSKATNLLDEKQGKLDELNSQWSDFENQRKSLLGSISDIKGELSSTAVSSSSLDGVQEFAKQVKVLELQLDQHLPEMENLKTMSRQLMASDPTNIARAQSTLGAVESEFEHLRGSIAEKENLAAGVLNQWNQFNDSRTNLNRILSKSEEVLSEEEPHGSQAEVKAALDKIKVCVS